MSKIFRTLFCHLYICVLFAINTYPSYVPEIFTNCFYHTVNISFFVNETETDKNAPVSWALWDAINGQLLLNPRQQTQKYNTPILVVSDHLLYNIRSKFSLPDRNWIARKLSDHISLLIPKGLTEYYRKLSEIPSKIPVSENVYMQPLLYNINEIDDDHLLGINFSSLPELKKLGSVERIGREKLSLEVSEDITKLFISRSNYIKKWEGKFPPRDYNLLFIGHGAKPEIASYSTKNPIQREGAVSGLQTSDMNKILSTLSKTINILSATIYSCFIGDLNLLAILRKDTSSLFESQNFSFPIIITTPLATPIYSKETKTDFAGFFNELSGKHCDNQNFAKAISFLYDQKDVSNIPMIKMPRIPVFFPLNPLASQESLYDTKESAFYGEIGEILAAYHGKKLHIPSYFSSDSIQSILVHPQNIPFEIVIDHGTKNIPFFFSAEPGARIHAFSKIDASEHTISEVIYAFAPIPQYQWKVFTFDTIKAKDDIFKQDNKVKEFTKVAIINFINPSDEIAINVLCTIENQTLSFNWNPPRKQQATLGNIKLDLTQKPTIEVEKLKELIEKTEDLSTPQLEAKQKILALLEKKSQEEQALTKLAETLKILANKQ